MMANQMRTSWDGLAIGVLTIALSTVLGYLIGLYSPLHRTGFGATAGACYGFSFALFGFPLAWKLTKKRKLLSVVITLAGAAILAQFGAAVEV